MENLWPQLAGRQRLHSAKACAEFLGRQAPLAVQSAQKICGRVIPLLRIAVQATGNHVAVRIAPRRREWHHVVQAMGSAGDPAQAIKAQATLARVDGLAQRARSQEIELVHVGRATQLAPPCTERGERAAGSGSASERGSDL